MPTNSESRDPLIGARIDDRYTVLGLLGRGGMGVVYDGVHDQLGRQVAIKVLSAGIANSDVAVQRFLREARTASGLTHGNIVDVSDLGVLPDGRPYLVMPKMHGEDLCTLLLRLGPQTPARVVELLRGVAAALDLIHAKGYVHRDIKPENLMHVVREDGSEAVMVLDFGIVGLISTNAKRLTVEGTVFGTPAYLPPEVIEGDTMDRRGDVYALATCAFELMTGRLPFDAENPIRILPMKVMNDAPRLSTVSGVAFPEAIEAVIAKDLRRKPHERHGSAGEFVAALHAAVVASAGELAAPPVRDPAANREQLTTGKLMPIAATSSLERDLSRSESLPAGHDSGGVNVVFSDRAPIGAGEKTGSRRSLVIGVLVAGAAALVLALSLTQRGTPAATVTPAPLAHETSHEPAAQTTPTARPAAIAPTPTPAAAEPAATLAPVVAAAPAASVPAASTARGKRPAVSEKRESAPAPTSAATGLARIAPVPASPTASATDSQSAAELTKTAMQALLQGHPALAAELYTRATKADPRSDAAFRGLGITNEKLGKTAEAVRAWKRALELSPAGAQADSIRARLAKLEGQ